MGLTNMGPAPGYAISACMDGFKKWTTIQYQIIQQIENGMLKDDQSTLFALNVAAMQCSGKFSMPELSDQFVENLSNTYGEHVNIDKRFFDKNQLAAIDLLKKMSEEYDKANNKPMTR